MSSQWSSTLIHQDVLVTEWRQHPLVLVFSAAPAVIAAAIAMLLSRGGGFTGLRTLLWWLTLLLTLRFVWRAAQWWLSWVIVTNRQVQRVSGLLVRRSQVMPLAHVTGLACHRSVMGRVFGYGECVLQAAGQVQLLRLTFVPDPDERHLILTQLASGRREPR